MSGRRRVAAVSAVIRRLPPVAIPMRLPETGLRRIGILTLRTVLIAGIPLLLRKKPVYHILDLVFGLHGTDRPAPTLTERWENRQNLRDTLAEQYLGERTERKETMNLYMEETLKHQLSREMILESDMAEVIAWCESTGRKVKNSSGHFIGHKKIQNMTYWAEYQPEGDGYRLFTGYAHRMCLEEENK